jgi:hypothetical protein
VFCLGCCQKFPAESLCGSGDNMPIRVGLYSLLSMSEHILYHRRDSTEVLYLC